MILKASFCASGGAEDISERNPATNYLYDKSIRIESKIYSGRSTSTTRKGTKYVASVMVPVLIFLSIALHDNKSITRRVVYAWQCEINSRWTSSSTFFRIQPTFLATGTSTKIVTRNMFYRKTRRPNITQIRMMDKDSGNNDDKNINYNYNSKTFSKTALLTSASSSTTTAVSKPSSYFLRTSVLGPDVATKPDYDNIVGPLGKVFDTLLIIVFRKQLAKHVGWDSALPIWDYNGIIEITQYMNRSFRSRKLIQETSQNVLLSLFPSWLPKQFGIMFSQPFPIFSARLNAWATCVAGTWLMGECEVNDVVVIADTSNDIERKTIVLEKQGLYVKRCRFLEESSCASVCVNSCKIPTQNFFQQNMNLPLRMEPNYTTYECQFSFGISPTDASELVALSTPCLSRCPSFGSIRQYHEVTETNNSYKKSVSGSNITTRTNSEPYTDSKICAIMTD
jgi:Beta-carotene isomerase D27-like, C-terminal